MSKSKGLKENYEYIVIGTGPGGGTVARDLALAGKSVLMIEAGAWHRRGLGSLLGVRILKGYLMLSRSREGVIVARGMTVGGSSMVYNGNVFDPPDFLYEEMGLDFRAEVDEIKIEIGVKTLPEKFFVNARGGLRGREAAAKMGITFKAQEKFIDPEKCSVGCDWCMMGCPKNAKWTTRTYVEEALDHGADLIVSAPVDRIVFDARGRAVAVRLKNGEQIHADRIVLSAGGIGTPEILLRSGMKNVGESFFMDPMNVITGYADDESGGAWREMTFTHASDDFEHSDGFLIGNVGGSYSLLSNFSRIKTMRKNALKMLPLMKRGIGLFVKLGDNPNGQVFRNGRFSKPMDGDDLRRMNKGTEICRDILVRAGVRPSTIAVAEMIGGHPGGTAAMGLIVDRTFQTEHDNLYVCDGSVLPVSPGAPPSLAILAYSRLCARMLLGRVRAEDRMVRKGMLSLVN
jgi:choline dehydrogenase-like flavoprotein